MERLGEPGLAAEARSLRRMRDALARRPADAGLAARLARRCLQLSRAEGDARYLSYAQAALAPWWNAPGPPNEILALRAGVKQSNHDFAGAQSDLSFLLKSDPENAQACLTLATILQVQGRYSEAKEAGRPLWRAAPGLALACNAGINGFSGHAEQSEAVLRRALRGGLFNDSEQKIWALGLLADLAVRRGEPAAAKAYFDQAFRLGRRDIFLLAAYADFQLDQGHAEEVVRLLSRETQVDGLLLRLALAEKILRAPGLQAHLDLLKARVDAARLRGDARHKREEALFFLLLQNDPAEALRLANENWAVQREPEDLRILIQAALAARDQATVQSALQWRRRAGLEDVRIDRLLEKARRAP